MCCSVVHIAFGRHLLQCVAVMLQCVAVCCSRVAVVLQLQCVLMCCSVMHILSAIIYCSVWQCVAECASVLQCVAMCCNCNLLHNRPSHRPVHMFFPSYVFTFYFDLGWDFPARARGVGLAGTFCFRNKALCFKAISAKKPYIVLLFPQKSPILSGCFRKKALCSRAHSIKGPRYWSILYNKRALVYETLYSTLCIRHSTHRAKNPYIL